MITLNLSQSEAYYLQMILHRIGGDPKGPRGNIDTILEKLGNQEHLFIDCQYPPVEITCPEVVETVNKFVTMKSPVSLYIDHADLTNRY